METPLSAEALNAVLSALTDSFIAGTTRAADVECFKIAGHNNTQLYALHVQGCWRFTNSNTIITGNDDLYIPAAEDDTDTDFDRDIPGINKRDVALEKLIGSGLSITSVKNDNYGGLILYFENGLIFEAFANAPSLPEQEYWRLLDFTASCHYVSTSNGSYKIQ